MTNDPWRYTCPHCGCHGFETRSGKAMGPNPKNPSDRYRCRDCRKTFNEPHDKKASATPEEAEA